MKGFQQTYEVDATRDAIFPLISEAADFVKEQGAAAQTVEFFRLALEELLMNICNHSGLGENDAVKVHLESDGENLRLILRDRGMAFDPFSIPHPDTSASPGEHSIGGLGIHLIRETTSSYVYQRDGVENVVELAWDEGESTA